MEFYLLIIIIHFYGFIDDNILCFIFHFKTLNSVIELVKCIICYFFW